MEGGLIFQEKNSSEHFLILFQLEMDFLVVGKFLYRGLTPSSPIFSYFSFVFNNLFFPFKVIYFCSLTEFLMCFCFSIFLLSIFIFYFLMLNIVPYKEKYFLIHASGLQYCSPDVLCKVNAVPLVSILSILLFFLMALQYLMGMNQLKIVGGKKGRWWVKCIFL